MKCITMSDKLLYNNRFMITTINLISNDVTRRYEKLLSTQFTFQDCKTFSPIQVVGLEIVSFIELVPTITSYLRAFLFFCTEVIYRRLKTTFGQEIYFGPCFYSPGAAVCISLNLFRQTILTTTNCHYTCRYISRIPQPLETSTGSDFPTYSFKIFQLW